MHPKQLPLEDIILPPAVGLWPLAWGWWLVIALSALALLGLAYALWRYWRLRRQTQAAIAQLHKDCEPLQDALLYSAVNTWLKLHAAPEARALHGQAWQQYLEHSAGRAVFSQEQLEALSAGLYQAKPLALDKAALLDSATQWWRLSRKGRART